MKVATEPQLKHEIQRIDSLIRQLDRLHGEAKALMDDDLRESVLISLDDLIETLRDDRTKMQSQLDHLSGTENVPGVPRR